VRFSLIALTSLKSQAARAQSRQRQDTQRSLRPRKDPEQMRPELLRPTRQLRPAPQLRRQQARLKLAGPRRHAGNTANPPSTPPTRGAPLTARPRTRAVTSRKRASVQANRIAGVLAMHRQTSSWFRHTIIEYVSFVIWIACICIENRMQLAKACYP